MEKGKMYCKHCGGIIDSDCIICPKCGKQVGELKQSKPIIINNTASSSSAAAVTAPQKRKKKYSLFFDLFMIIMTAGLWIIWMIIRPKYEY